MTLDDGAHVLHHVRREVAAQLQIDRDVLEEDADCAVYEERQSLKLAAIDAQRRTLRTLREDGTIGEDSFATLQEELEWRELATGPRTGRTIEEG